MPLFISKSSPVVKSSLRNILCFRSITSSVDCTNKYAVKLRRRAEENGLSVEQLKQKVRKEAQDQLKRRRDEKNAAVAATLAAHPPVKSHVQSSNAVMREHKDSSPIRALSSILNIPTIFSTPHTAAQLSDIWRAYHASKSHRTGRGYLCASIPSEVYRKMASIAAKYPSFIVPIPRPRTDVEEMTEGEQGTAFEFYFLQWDFHGIPPNPNTKQDLFAKTHPSPASDLQNATILFTPLQEYKLRGSFATPYLVLTQYTDLVSTHGIVLMRGEITPSSTNLSGSEDRYLLSQEDAHFLSVAVQKLYLWRDSKNGVAEKEIEILLRTFHEKPEEFKWERLLKHAQLTI